MEGRQAYLEVAASGAGNVDDSLRTVCEGLSHRVVTDKKETEVTGVVALAAALLTDVGRRTVDGLVRVPAVR